MVTLSAHASMKSLGGSVATHAGIVIAVLVLSGALYLYCGCAPRLIKAISASTVHGILRVIAFIPMCIGVQIAWNGISLLGPSLLTLK